MLERHNGLDPDPDGAFTYYDQAQATIADLQGQLEAAQKDNRSYIDERHENMKTIESLQQRVAQLAEKVAHYDRWLSGGVYFTKAEYEVHVKDRNNLREEHIKLQADHARVLGAIESMRSIIPHQHCRTCQQFVDELVKATLPAQPVCTNHFSDGSKIFPSRECACKPAQPAQGGA